MRWEAASGVGYGAIGGATSALIAPYVVSAAGGAQNLTDGQRAAIVGMSTLLGGLTAGLAGQNAQGGAAAAENEVLNNSLGDHRTEAQKEQDEQKEELSQERAKLSGGLEIVGYDAEGNPEYAVKPSPSMLGPGGATGSSQGAAGNTVRVGGGSAVGVDVGNGANDWNDASTANNGATSPVGISGSPMTVPKGTNTPTTINGTDYSGHAIDQMQGRGIPPSVVQNTIENGQPFPTRPGTTGYYDPVNNVRVITNSNTGRVVTVIPGAPGK